MKRTILLLAALCALGRLPGQEAPADTGDDLVPKNKKGREILPKEGDIALGFNTVPLLNVIFDLFRSTGASPQDLVQYTSSANNQVTGKYFLDRQTAVRVRFGINTLSGTVRSPVQDAAVMHQARMGTPDDIDKASLVTVDDKLTFSKNNILFSAGLEKRRGYRRLQGFYGAEIGIGSSGSRENVTYGNGFSDQYAVEFTNNFNTFSTTNVLPNSPGRTERTLEVRHRGGIRVGLRGFVGIEYFVFAKISVAAEYGWGYSLVTRRAVTLEREVYNNGQNGPTVLKETVETDSREVLRGFSVDNNNSSAFSLNNTLNGNTVLNGGAGALTLFFHF
jgi:hypothetical protein